MIDRAQVRARIKDLGTTELLRVAMAEAERLRPEALEVWRDELGDRLGDLETYMSDCANRFGSPRGAVAKVTNFRAQGSKDPYVGRLVLSTGGLGFRAHGSDDLGVPAGPLLGPLLAPVYTRLFENQTSEAAATAELPVPFLAQIYEEVVWYDRDQLARIDLTDGRVLSIFGPDDTQLAWGVCPDADVNRLRAWAREIDVSFTETESVSLLKRAKQWFSRRRG